MELEPPETLRQPLFVPPKTLMGAGPTNCSPRVLAALQRPPLGITNPETYKIMDEIKQGIRYVFQTRNELTLALSTTGHGGMEAALCNLLENGDEILVAVNGIWGQRATEMAKRYGGTVYTLEATPGRNFTLAQIQGAVEKTRPKILFMVQGESSTGVFQPLEGVGEICRRYNCLFVVDTVASLCGVPLFADRWKIDAIYTCTQKVLGAPAGLAPISFSPRAQEIIFTRKTPVSVFYWDMTILGQQWGCFNNEIRPYHHTISTNLLYSLRESLAIIIEEGLENVIKRHENCAKLLRSGVTRLGLEFFVKDETNRLNTITTISVENNVDWRKLIKYAMDQYLLEISAGLGPTKDKVIRIGLLGENATKEKVLFVLHVLKEFLEFEKRSKSKL